MKYLSLIVSILFLSVGCDKNFSQNSTSGVSSGGKECEVLEEAQDCLMKEEEPIRFCMERLQLLSFIGTKHEHLLDDYLNGEIKAHELIESVSRKDLKTMAVNGYQKNRKLFDINSPLDTILNMKEHYSCPAEEV